MTNLLSISNIAWNHDEKESVYELLANLGITGVEVALTKFGAWEEIDKAKIKLEREQLRSSGLSVSSYQALFFGVPSAQLLSDYDAFKIMKDHLVKVACLAEELSGGGAAVFGSPGNRRRAPHSVVDAEDLGASRLYELAEAVNDHGLILALEPAPLAYGGDFLIDTAACERMVRRVNHPSLRLHLDSGCIELAGETSQCLIESVSEIVCHAHLSRPGLLPIGGELSRAEAVLSETIKAISYKGWIAIEMRQAPDTLSSIRSAIEKAKLLFPV